jgi:hypothetical protein
MYSLTLFVASAIRLTDTFLTISDAVSLLKNLFSNIWLAINVMKPMTVRETEAVWPAGSLSAWRNANTMVMCQ